MQLPFTSAAVVTDSYERALRDDGPIPVAALAELERLRGEVARLQSERDALEIEKRSMAEQIGHQQTTMVERYQEIQRLRAEVTAAKADALEQAADQLRHQRMYFPSTSAGPGAHISSWLRARAADIRAERQAAVGTTPEPACGVAGAHYSHDYVDGSRRLCAGTP